MGIYCITTAVTMLQILLVSNTVLTTVNKALVVLVSVYTSVFRHKYSRLHQVSAGSDKSLRLLNFKYIFQTSNVLHKLNCTTVDLCCDKRL